MGENQTAAQEFVESLADLVPGQAIILSDEKGVAIARAKDYSQLVKEKTPLLVRICNFGEFKGSPEEILEQVKKKAQARAAVA